MNFLQPFVVEPDDFHRIKVHFNVYFLFFFIPDGSSFYTFCRITPDLLYWCFEVRIFSQLFSADNKGVSDLETCMTYFALPGRNLNFLAHLSWNDMLLKKSINVQKTFRLTQLTSQFGWLLKLFGRENKNSNFHNFLLEVQKNPHIFLNLRHLYPLLYLNFTLMCETLSWRLLEFNNFLHFLRGFSGVWQMDLF